MLHLGLLHRIAAASFSAEAEAVSGRYFRCHDESTVFGIAPGGRTSEPCRSERATGKRLNEDRMSCKYIYDTRIRVHPVVGVSHVAAAVVMRELRITTYTD